MMMAKKKTLFLLLMLVSLLLCACAGNAQEKDTGSADIEIQESGSPKVAVEYVMTSLKELDLDTFNAYTDNYICTHRNWIGVPTSEEYRVFNELLQPTLIKGKHYGRNYRLSKKLMENLSWEITNVCQSGDTAEIVMNITNIDMASVTENYTTFLLENMAESKEPGMVSLIKDLSDLTRNMDNLISFIDAADTEDTCVTNVTLTARLEDGQWKIHVSDEFINAFMGNIDSEVYPEEKPDLTQPAKSYIPL